jgi:hypothetical protein
LASQLDSATQPPVSRLRLSLEQAWHALAAGSDPKATIQRLDRVARAIPSAAPDVAAAWLRWRTFLLVTAAAEQASEPAD